MTEHKHFRLSDRETDLIINSLEIMARFQPPGAGADLIKQAENLRDQRAPTDRDEHNTKSGMVTMMCLPT